eukprot:6713252-Prymnesium_polylepis.2
MDACHAKTGPAAQLARIDGAIGIFSTSVLVKVVGFEADACSVRGKLDLVAAVAEAQDVATTTVQICTFHETTEAHTCAVLQPRVVCRRWPFKAR